MIRRIEDFECVESFSGSEKSYTKLRRHLGIPGKLFWFLIARGLIKNPDLINVDTGEVGFEMVPLYDVYSPHTDDDDWPTVNQKDVYKTIEKYLNKSRNVESIFFDLLVEDKFIDPVGAFEDQTSGEFKLQFDKREVEEFFDDEDTRDEFLGKF